MIDSYENSIAPGTAANRLTQAKSYIGFAVRYGVNPLRPSRTDLCMYLQFLVNSHSAPTTVKNYLSGARSWMAEHGGDISPFSSFGYLQLYSGISKRSSHVPKRAEPLTWTHIKMILDFLDSSPSIPRGAKPCIIIGYFTFLRASNLLSPTINSWGGPHTILAQDITASEEGLSVSV